MGELWHDLVAFKGGFFSNANGIKQANEKKNTLRYLTHVYLP